MSPDFQEVADRYIGKLRELIEEVQASCNDESEFVGAMELFDAYIDGVLEALSSE